jgi:hypothetical protein
MARIAALRIAAGLDVAPLAPIRVGVGIIPALPNKGLARTESYRSSKRVFSVPRYRVRTPRRLRLILGAQANFFASATNQSAGAVTAS